VNHFNTTVYFISGDDEIECPVEVTFDFEREQRQTRDEPGYPACLAITEVTQDGVSIYHHLSRQQIETLEREAWDELSGRERERIVIREGYQ
jgi:hypothetical protein